METDAPRVATAVTTVRVRRDEEGAFAVWLTEFNETVASFPGYISAVVIPPVPPSQSDWVMVQRFQTIQQLGAWLDSHARSSLVAKGTSLLVDEGTTNVIEGASTEPSPHNMVTEIITVSVKPGIEERTVTGLTASGRWRLSFRGIGGCRMTGSRCSASILRSI